MVTNIEGSVVRMKGLEPPRLAAPDPKSGTATNYATSAIKISVVKWNLSQIIRARPPAGEHGSNYATSAKGGANLWIIRK